MRVGTPRPKGSSRAIGILVAVLACGLMATGAALAACDPEAEPEAAPVQPVVQPSGADLPRCARPGDSDCAGATVLIPAGSFWMGCNSAADTDCDEDEKPQHEVHLDAYFITRYTVTAAEFRTCVAASVCTLPMSPIVNDCSLVRPGYDAYPADCTTWFDARAYCAWLGMRLPTEAEWEKAGRGGCELYKSCRTEMPIYPWGNHPEPSCKYAVMKDGGIGCGKGEAQPVGSRPLGASPYGLADMAGNVWEWIEDSYDEKFYETAPHDNPVNDTPSELAVTRGGDFLYGEPHDMRLSNRDIDYKYAGGPGTGFRCAKTAPTGGGTATSPTTERPAK